VGNGVYSGTLPDYPTCDFYVEGIFSSKQENDIKLQVTSQGAKDEKPLTVTPVVQSFKTTIPTPSVAFEAAMYDPTVVDGSVGLRAAKPAATPDGDITPGIRFDSHVLLGDDEEISASFLQNLLSVTNGFNGSAAGFIYAPQFNIPNQNLKIRVTQGKPVAAFPILDAIPPGDDPLYPTDVAPFPNAADIIATDAPSMVAPTLEVSKKLAKMDVKETFCTYVVAVYSDGSVYALANMEWSVNFYADTWAQDKGVTRIDAASKVAVERDWRRDISGPAKTAKPVALDSTTITSM
jgi:hypothetical protein